MSSLPEQPDWSSLHPDLWRSVLLSTAGQRLDERGWRQWCSLLVTVSSTCRSLREALLGPDAGALWSDVRLHSATPGLNALAASQGHHATTVMLHGGGWQPDTLRSILAALTHADLELFLLDMDDGTEAAVLGEGLSGASCTMVTFTGSVPVELPCSVQTLSLCGQPLTSLLPDGSVDQSAALRLFDCLAPLAALKSLTLALPVWQLTAELAQRLTQQHPVLQDMCLHINACSSLGPQTVSDLAAAAALTMHIAATDNSLTQLLQSLHGVQLVSLEINEVEEAEYRLTLADDYNLARCSISRQLTLGLVDPVCRLQTPTAFPVVYKLTTFLRPQWNLSYDNEFQDPTFFVNDSFGL